MDMQIQADLSMKRGRQYSRQEKLVALLYADND
jgi:hypothetical protein